MVDLVESRSTDSDQKDFIERVIHLGSVILKAGKRCARKRATVHNISVWPLSPEIRIKVFSIVDTRSVCSAAATCSFFQKCATDPVCYSNIELATLPVKLNIPKFNDVVVSTMIERAGKTLESIKLVAPHSYISDVNQRGNRTDSTESPILTFSCLSSLNVKGGAPGSRLRTLHLEYIGMSSIIRRDEKEVTEAVSASLSACPSLVELKLVRMDVYISRIVESVSTHCRLLERFIFEWNAGRPDLLEASVCKEFVVNCPKITTLVLQAYQVFHSEAFELVKGFHELKYVDFSGSYSLTGAFLENLATKGDVNSLEVMILSRLYDGLAKVEIKKFMEAFLQESSGSYDIFFIPIEELLKQRPNFCLVTKRYK